MMDYTREELLQMSIEDICGPEYPEELEKFATLVREGTYLGEIRLRRRDGKVVPAEINAVRLPDGTYLGTVRDITERKRAEEALVCQTALEQRDQARLEFLQIAAHELRTPMTAIKGACGLLGQMLPPSDRQTAVNRLCEIVDLEVDHLSSLLDEVLQAFRLQAGHLPFDFKRVDLNSVVDAALAPFTLSEHGSRLVFNGVGEGEVMVDGDSRRLGEVVRNLVHNALKYSEGSGDVTVRVVVGDGKVLLTITDHGIGIPEGELSEIFEAFHRAANLVGRDPGGLGLGLKICQEIVLQHHGRIWAESEPGRVTTFFVELPLATDHA
jgi:signal transduction histidine kinase